MSNLEANANKINEIIGYHQNVGTPMPHDRWPWNFLNSVLVQCMSGRKELSPRQVEVLDDINDKWGRVAVEKKSALNAAWQERFDSDPQLKQRTQWVMDSLNAQKLSDYGWNSSLSRQQVLKSGWWSTARIMWDSTGRISESYYDRMVVNNPYSKKLIETMEAPPRFDHGQLVSLRTGVMGRMTNHLNAEQAYQRLLVRWSDFESGKDNISTQPTLPGIKSLNKINQLSMDRGRKNVAMVIGIDSVPSISNAKGSRTYELMPVGELAEAASRLVLEERWLKKAPKSM